MQEPVTTFEVDGQAIWAARMAAGISVRELATAVGVSDSYIRKLERGIRRQVSPGPYRRLWTFLNASEKQFLASPRTQSEERK